MLELLLAGLIAVQGLISPAPLPAKKIPLKAKIIFAVNVNHPLGGQNYCLRVTEPGKYKWVISCNDTWIDPPLTNGEDLVAVFDGYVGWFGLADLCRPDPKQPTKCK